MQSEQSSIAPNAVVRAKDGILGVVDEVIVHPGTGRLSYLLVKSSQQDPAMRVRADLIDSVPSPDLVRLRVNRKDARELATAALEEDLIARQEGNELHIPIHEERLSVGTRPVDLGELLIHKRVEEVPETVRQLVTRDDVEIQRVAVNRALDAPVEMRTEDGWLVIPVMEEILVVHKQLQLKEEIRVRTRQVTVEEELTETIRHERVDFEDATVHGLTGLPSTGPKDTVPTQSKNKAAGANSARVRKENT